jgi:hypothetical protein
MAEKTPQNMQLTEENVVTKVAELLETLDQVKKYNALSNALKKFALIVISSLLVFLAVGASIDFLNLVATLERPQIVLYALLMLLIPISGVAVGVLYIRKKIGSVKADEWKEELSNGFPSALKILTELDWDRTFDEISFGRVGYAVYTLLKVVAYWVITFFTVGLIGNLVGFLVLHKVGVFGGPILGLISIIIVYVLLRKDFSRRYHQIRALDKLLWELRWLSVELRSAEF